MQVSPCLARESSFSSDASICHRGNRFVSRRISEDEGPDRGFEAVSQPRRALHAERGLQVTFDDFKEFASLRKELHDLQVAVEFYQKTTGHFGLSDLKVRI